MSLHNDTQFEHLLGRVLRFGVATSSTCLALGLIVAMAGRHGGLGVALMTAGLVTLMATPVVRVVASTAEYVLHREWTFAILTFVVLIELCASVVAALLFNRTL
jgi:uncharacterized membrane protein